MARRRKKGRDICGIVVVDKPGGVSSNKVLQQVKRLFDANKAGHTGNLDPLATGVLPICLGEATKLSGYLLDADKAYQVRCQLGSITDSGDSDGEVIEQLPVPEFSRDQLEQIVKQFIGQQQQVPPMFSALKQNGQPLYKLARQGIEVERKARAVTLYDIQLLDCTPDSFTLEVSCSKGTYIRTLVQDIAAKLGTGGHVTMLRRIRAAGYQLADCLTLAELEQLAADNNAKLDQQLLPAAEALPDWPQQQLSADQVSALQHGQPVTLSSADECANVRLFDAEQQFFGLGQISADGVLTSKRLFAIAQT